MSVAQCGNCKAVFKKPKIVHRSVYGVDIVDKVCPECGALGYTKLTTKLLGFLARYENVDYNGKERRQ